jgi:biopolymer transport protein ExbB/TolQ
MSKKGVVVVKSEQDKGLVTVMMMMMMMMMIFCAYSIATWCTSYDVIRKSYLLIHATSPFLLKTFLLQNSL